MTSARVLNDKPDWEGATDWPNRAHSHFIDAGGLRWHVQLAGTGPALLLVHGTAAANHSWGALLPLLAAHYRVVAPDLPGHGFTAAPDPRQLSLPGMAAALAALLHRLEQKPQVVVGHSAGAAILARMCLDGLIQPQRLISLNGALLPLRGMAGKVFSPAAKLLARLSLVPRIVGHDANRAGAIERLVDSTGSQLDARGIAAYRMLMRSPGHVAAALNMMANWELDGLARDLPRLPCALHLVVGTNDRTLPPAEAERVRRILPSARIERLPGLGHLAHEEAAEQVAALILADQDPL
jgi:magnesium chelatase accessory protein